jgi:hypothetical protein
MEITHKCENEDEFVMEITHKCENEDFNKRGWCIGLTYPASAEERNPISSI